MASRRWSYRGILPEAILDDVSVDALTSQFADGLAQLDSDSAVFVAERAGRIVGYASVEPGGPSGEPVGGAELDSIYVLEEVAGTGVADALMEAAATHARARGHHDLWLWVRRDNVRARGFYEKLGFALEDAERVRPHPALSVEIEEVRYRLAL